MAAKKQAKISTHVEVTGEAQYKKTIADCRKEVELFNSEQKLIEAQFKNTGDQEQYNASMADLLRRKLEAQNKAVNASAEYLQKLSNKGVDPTSASYVRWAKTLDQSRADYINTQTELNKLLEKQHAASGEMAKNGQEAADGYTNPLITGLTKLKKVTDFVGGVGGDMNFTALNTAIGNLQKIIDPEKENDFLNGLRDTASELTAVQQVSKGISGLISAAIANPTMAGIGAAAALLLSLDDIEQALNELERERQFAWVDQLKALDAGISEEGIAAIKNGIQRGVKEGIDEADIVNVLGREVAEGFAAQSFQLVTAGYGRMENIGAGMSYVNAVTKDELTKAREEMEAAKDAVQAEQDAAVLEKDVQKADELQKQYDQIDADYQQKVNQIEARQNEMVNQLVTGSMSLLDQSVDVDALNQQMEKMALYAEALQKMGITSPDGEMSSVFTFDENDTVTGLSDYAQRLADLWNLTIEDFQGSGIFTIADRLTQELGNASQEALAGEGVGVLADLFSTWADAGMLKDVDFSEASGALLAAYRSSLLKDAAGEDQKFNRDELLNVLGGDEFQEAGSMAAGGYAGGIRNGTGDADAAGRELANSSVAATMEALDENSPSKVFEEIGGNAAAGLANGIYERADEAIAAARWLADSVASIVQEALDIHSPSKVFEELGSFTALGFAEGIENTELAVNRAIDSMIRVTSALPVMQLGGMPAAAPEGLPGRQGGAARSGAAGKNIKAYVVLDKTIVGEMLAPVVDGFIGAELQARR